MREVRFSELAEVGLRRMLPNEDHASAVRRWISIRVQTRPDHLTRRSEAFPGRVIYISRVFVSVDIRYMFEEGDMIHVWAIGRVPQQANTE